MPTSLQYPLKLKKLRVTALFLLSPLLFYGQSLTGLWVGTLSNDSNTVRKDQSFEIALTEYKGKVYGYSRSEFIVNDTLYYIVKRVKGTIDGDICEVTDDEIIAYNFSGKLDKGIKVTSTFRKNKNDSTWYLEGSWKTNANKKYYAITGKMNLGEEKDLMASKIFPHLEELKLANDVAFYKDRVEGPPVVKLVQPEKIKTEYYSTNFIAENKPAPVVKLNELKRAETKIPEATEAPAYAEVQKLDKPSEDLPKTDINTPGSATVSIKPDVVEKTIAKNDPPKNLPAVTASPNNPPTSKPVQDKPVVANNKPVTKPVQATVSKPEPVTVQTKPVVENKQPVTTSGGSITTPVQDKPLQTVAVNKIEQTKKPAADIMALSATVAGRKSEFTQMVSFKSDSLQLALYDNGEIDGDTVSVYLNGEIILSKQGLKSSAIRKTIHIPDGYDEFTLVLFAENLGKYPPNTGLLVVRDGEDIYNLRFSSDLQKNAGIVFKKRQ